MRLLTTLYGNNINKNHISNTSLRNIKQSLPKTNSVTCNTVESSKIKCHMIYFLEIIYKNTSGALNLPQESASHALISTMHIYIYHCILRSGAHNILFVFLLYVTRKTNIVLNSFNILQTLFILNNVIKNILKLKLHTGTYASYIVMTWPFLLLNDRGKKIHYNRHQRFCEQGSHNFK